MFQQIIELLLQEKASLDSAMALEIEVAVNEIKSKYAEHSEKVDTMLSLAGYVKPVIDEELEAIDAEVVTETVDEVVDETVDEVVDETVETADEVVDNATEAESGKALYTI